MILLFKRPLPACARLFSTTTRKKSPPDPLTTFAYSKSAQHEAAEDAAERRALQQSPLTQRQISRALLGNGFLAAMKFGVYFQSGSSAVLSEAIHTLADCGNQALLQLGHAEASKPADKVHPFGYGRAAFFWSMTSGVGIFLSGAGVAFGAGLAQVMHPATTYTMSQEMILVMGLSFCVDGYVLIKTLVEENRRRLPGVSLVEHLRGVRDPFTLAILLEDFAACTGVLVASTGILLTNASGLMAFDTVACFSVGLLMASVGAKLASFNRRFLIGVAVDDKIVQDIERFLRTCPSIHSVRDIQTQWVGPHAFMIKAECDFEGAYFAHLLEDLYAPLLMLHDKDNRDELWLTLGLFSEDVTRLIEIEVHEIEARIREKHPQAAFIHLEPDSKYSYLKAFLPVQRQPEENWLDARQDKLRSAPEALRRRAQVILQGAKEQDVHVDDKAQRLIQLAEKIERYVPNLK